MCIRDSHGADRDSAVLREPALGTILEPHVRGAHLHALLPAALDLPGLDAAGKDSRVARPLAGARHDGPHPRLPLLPAALRLPLAGPRALIGSREATASRYN